MHAARWATLALTVGSLFACVSAPTRVADEEVAVRSAWHELSAAFTSKDWARYTELWVHGPYLQVLHPGQRDWITGWETFAARYEPLVTSDVQWELKTNRLDVHVAPDGKTAWGIGEVVVTADGRSQTSWQTVVFQKTDDVWRIAAAMASLVPTTGAAVAQTTEANATVALQDSDSPLQRLVGRWDVTASTFGGLEDGGVRPTFVAIPVAGGQAVYSVWRQGSGSSAYEANALWAYDARAGEVRVFEANSVGSADTHRGSFDSSGVLLLEMRDSATNRVAQRRTFSWAGDTLRMNAHFYTTSGEVAHSATLVRQ